VLLRYHACNLDCDKAAAIARVASALLSANDVPPLHRASWLIELALSLSLELKHEDALAVLEEASEVSRSNGLANMEGRLGHVRHLIYVASGQHGAMRGHIESLKSLVNALRPLDTGVLQRALSDEALVQGETAQAVMHAQSAVELADQSGFKPEQMQGRILLAAMLVADGRCDEAAVCLDAAKALIAGTWFHSMSRDACLVEASIAMRRKDSARCRAALDSALRASRGERLASLMFMFHPALMSELCAEGLRTSLQPESIKQLIARYRLAPTSLDVEAWPWPIKIYTLGGFHVLKDGAEIRFKRKTQKRPLELLQALIALGGSEVAVSTLTEALWRDAEGDAGYHAFENALYRLRQLLGSTGTLTLANGKLSLDPRHCWVDVWAFERRLAEARDTDAQSARSLEATLELYRGHFLEHEGQPSWALAMRERLRDKFVRHVRSLAQSYERAKSWGEAVAIYQRGLELDNLTEDLYRGLMICYRELGNQTEGLKVFRRCRELLSIVLGLQPTAQTQAVYESLGQR
jgi:LuxR family maltose regulon positive regulatory protein